ncbi:hypothetical protein OYC64_017761 [Pagothenia borchgrevinki]|uniref:Uncharacterized protein n=1 Tax=Pagothenia borchgrevinki TaxID=8213 RepID=A0ABD2FWD5_PAGBO
MVPTPDRTLVSGRCGSPCPHDACADSVWKALWHLQSKTAVLADNRIRIMNEVVSGIRIIKMYAWEKPFSALVTDVRR